MQEDQPQADLQDEIHEAPVMTMIARLDVHGVYQGLVETDAREVKESDVHLPNGCDLPPGKYRWDEVTKAFVPLRSLPPDKVFPPDALQAIAAGLDACRRHGVQFPKVTVDWLDWYSKTWDRMIGG